MKRTNSRSFAPFLAAALIIGGSISAIELRDAGTKVDTVVIDTDYGVELTPASAPIPFKSFRYPYLDEQENVTFIGNDPFIFGQAKKGNGIYRSFAADGRIESLVGQDDLSPDDGKPIGAIMGLRTDFKSIIFHRGSDWGTGIYGRFNEGHLVTIASKSTRVPGMDTDFKWFWYADVSDDLVVFNATPQLQPEWINGLYLYRHSLRKVARLIDTTLPVPALGGARLAGLSYQPRIDRDWLVFSASRWINAEKVDPQPSGVFGWKIAPDRDPDEMFSLDKLQVIAPLGMEIPESGGLKLTSASNPTSSGGTLAVMAGSHAEGETGELPKWQAILVRTADGVWHNPVDTNTLNPILNDGSYFTGFSKWVGMQNDKVVFVAKGPDEYQAVYIYDVKADLLYFIADTRLTIDNRKISTFETSGHPLVGKRLALMIRFSDGSAGEYLATLPRIPTGISRKQRR